MASGHFDRSFTRPQLMCAALMETTFSAIINRRPSSITHPPQAPTNQLTNGFPQIFAQTKVPCIDVRLMYDSRGFLGKSADLTNRFLIYI